MRSLIMISIFAFSPFAFSFEGALISSGNMAFGNALVELKPKRHSDENLVFLMYVNTHSESFEEYDLKELTTLYINTQEISPITVPELLDHHNEGDLVFYVPGPIETDIKIVIKDFAGETIREFKWSRP